jgi:hypothetical protein
VKVTCPRCGEPNDLAMRYCACGARLPQPGDQPREVPQETLGKHVDACLECHNAIRSVVGYHAAEIDGGEEGPDVLPLCPRGEELAGGPARVRAPAASMAPRRPRSGPTASASRAATAPAGGLALPAVSDGDLAEGAP